MTTSTFEAPEAGLHQRRELAEAKRIVVKVGSSSLTSMSAVPLRKSMRTRSPVCNRASPPFAAASGEALRIEGEPLVPD